MGNCGVGVRNFPLLGSNTLVCYISIGHLQGVTGLTAQWETSSDSIGLSRSFSSCRDRQERTPYCVSADKPTRNAFRKFMVDHPDKYDYSRAKVGACPLPLPSGDPEQSGPQPHPSILLLPPHAFASYSEGDADCLCPYCPRFLAP